VVGEIQIGNTSKAVAVNYSEPNPPPDEEEGEGEGEPEETTGDPGCPASPLLIDVKGNGFRLTKVANGVLFDIDGDGHVEQVGWTHPDSDDVWLALDRNGNGVIDSGVELFGNHTPLIAGQSDTAANGFDALNFLHSETIALEAALDQAISVADNAWDRLLLWRDSNHNGISEPGELTRVVDSPLARVDLAYREVSRVRKGNEIRQASSVLWGSTTRRIVDVWLNVIEK
jgi:hypothetical protein